MAMGTKIVHANGKTYKYPRNYNQEYQDRTPRQKHNRVIRRAARTKLISEYGKSALAGKDVDHKRGIGGGNSNKNLRITSIHFNRARKSTKWR